MRSAEERQFTTHDGTSLFYRYWPAQGAPGSPGPCRPRAIVLFHRGHEHSGRLQHVVDELGLPDFAVFAWDARGHGRSPGARGDSSGFAASVKDVDVFVRHVCATFGIDPADVVVIGQSVGAVLAATWAHDCAPRIRALVLTAPAFRVKLYVPFALPGLALMKRLRGNFFITSYVKARFLTHAPERIPSYETDPLITRAISARVLLELQAAADRVVADAQAIRLPVQALIDDAFSDAIFSDERRADRCIHDPADRIAVSENAGFSQRAPDELPCRIEIALADGSRQVAEGAWPLGHVRRPMTGERIEQKFLSLATRVLPQAQARRILGFLRALERRPRLDGLFDAARTDDTLSLAG